MANAKEILEFILKGNADDAIKAFEKTGKSADKDLGKAEKNLDKLGGTLTKTGAGAVAFAGVAGAAVVKTVGNFNDLAIEAGKGADATGLAVDEWSRWIEVAGDVGIESKTIEGSFLKFNKAVADGKSSISEYGVEIVKTKDGVVDSNASFINAIDTIGKIEDPTKRAAAAQELFGRGYGEIAELIEMGAGNVKTALEGVSDTKVIDQGELDRARDYRASMDALGDAAQDFALAVGQGATPVVQGFADAASKAIGFVSSLDQVTGGAAGKVIALGTAGVGALGALSLVVGQVVKMKDNLSPLTARLRNAEGGLTGLGKAGAAAGLGLGALGASIAAMDVLNEISGNSGNLERKLQALDIALSQVAGGADDGAAAMKAFRDQVAAEGKGLSVSNLWKDFGKEIKIVGGDIGRNVEEIDAAFKKVLSQDPSQAQTLLDVWRQQADALDHSSGQYQDNSDAIEKYQKWLDLLIVSTPELAGSTDELAAAQRRLDAAGSDLGDGWTGKVNPALFGMKEAADDASDAVGDLTEDTDGYVTAADKAAASTQAFNEKWDLLTSDLKSEKVLEDLAGQFTAAREKAAELYTQVQDGTITADEASTEFRSTLVDLNLDTLDYLQNVLKIPPERATEIKALIDQGKLDEAEHLLYLATLPREVDVKLKVSNTGAVSAILGVDRVANAAGGPVAPGQFSSIADAGRPEAFKGPDGRQWIYAPDGGQVLANPDVPGVGGNTYNLFPNATINQMVDVDAAVQRINLLLAS